MSKGHWKNTNEIRENVKCACKGKEYTGKSNIHTYLPERKWILSFVSKLLCLLATYLALNIGKLQQADYVFACYLFSRSIATLLKNVKDFGKCLTPG